MSYICVKWFICIDVDYAVTSSLYLRVSNDNNVCIKHIYLFENSIITLL